MGVDSKGKRKFVHHDRAYYWNVGQTKGSQTPYIIIQGNEFEGLESHARQGWTRVQTPVWEDTVITPSLVKTIIDWSLQPKDQIVLVDWNGRTLD